MIETFFITSIHICHQCKHEATILLSIYKHCLKE